MTERYTTHPGEAHHQVRFGRQNEGGKEILAGFILVCSRTQDSSRPSADDVRRCALRLTPDNIDATPPKVHSANGVTLAVVNPNASVQADPSGVCLGALFEPARWAVVGSRPPDGTYAIARHDESAVELVTDVFASRTIWYIRMEEVFLASTSQRALVALLRSYAPCSMTVTWLLAAGNLGPDRGWDERLRRVPSRSRLRLDRRSWSVSLSSEELTYVPREVSDEDHLGRLWEAIFSVCASLDTDEVPTSLTLSGGCDSRAILVGLADARKHVRCVTWGLAASSADPKNDAAIARRLAARFDMPHEYLELDYDGQPVRDIFTRFLRAGEGRIEDFSGYTDGLHTWRRLFSAGTAVVLRGDCPGWGSPYPPISETVARSINMHCTLVSDYAEHELIHRLGLAEQRRPLEFYQREGESLDGYRDRLYNDYELPTCMAAMNDVKCAYVEVVNPLYGRRVVQATTELPDTLRHCRNGFERLAATLVPEIPFSEHQADEPPERFLARPQMHEEMLGELSSQAARKVLSDSACEALIVELQRPAATARTSLRRRARTVVPRRVVRAVRPEPRVRLAVSRLAYRAYLASRMATILEQDAQTLAPASSGRG